MTYGILMRAALPALFLVAACARPDIVLQPTQGTPVYDKFGGVSYCVGPDGEEYPAHRGLEDPCEQLECPDGFLSPSGEFICPEDLPRRPVDSGSGDGDRGQPTTPGRAGP